MYNVLLSEEVRQAEKFVMDSGVDASVLRMTAAFAVADGILNRASKDGASVAVFCGAGGNGMDGLYAAAILKNKGCRVTAYLAGDYDKTLAALAPAAAYAKNLGLVVRPATEFSGDENIFIDAIFGIGLNRDLDEPTAALIKKLNGIKDAFKLAVDIPSGLNANTGEIMGEAFKAHVTICFSCYKLGMIIGQGLEYCGNVIIENVGIPTSSYRKVYDESDFATVERVRHYFKGDFGKIYVIGGSARMIGAPLMAGAAAHAAYLNGAGVVTVCVPEMLRLAVTARATMTTMKFLPDTELGYIKFDKPSLDEIISAADTVVIGMGMGETPDLTKILEYLCENFTGSLILDADALNAISLNYGFLNGKSKVIVTPHVGEFRRLTGKPATTENAVELARSINGIVVLKAATTIITDGKEVRYNTTGTPAMAKGGTGDLLGGAIGALCCSFDPFYAATVGCYRQGYGARRAVCSYAQLMLTPRDILNYADYPELYKN